MKIKILGIKYLIKKIHKNQLDKGDVAGSVSSFDADILLAEGMPADVEFSTFIHETIHAISTSMDLDLKESQVMGLECGIMSVLMDKENTKVLTDFYTNAKSIK